MKKLYPIILFVMSALYTQPSLAQQAGELWGMTLQGGQDGLGVIFKTAPDGTGQSVQKNFSTIYPGGYPEFGRLAPAPNGKLYGLTSTGGTFSAGVLFEYDAVTGAYTRKHDFNDITGGFPRGSLTLASNGRFYGMASQGGASGQGVLFEYDPATSAYVKLLDFDGANGNNPNRDVIQASNGKLYGMTANGGVNNFGVLFEYDLSTAAFSKKLDFGGAIGSSPFGNLTQAPNGKLYGMTSYGGANLQGVLFEYDPSTEAYAQVLDFNDTNGAYPYGSLTLASNGKLYGMTQQGGANTQGVLFEFDPASASIATVMDFNFANGANPMGDLMQASNGKLYGMTSQGGLGNYGVLFEYDLSAATYTKELDFNYVNGGYPYGTLSQAANGKIYGMGYMGGANYKGVLFEYDPSTTGFVKKLDFNNSSDGTNPHDSFIQAPDGKLYAMTSTGGANGYGVIFQYDPSSGSYTKKVDFDYTTKGATPYGSLTLATNGKAYGMNVNGGITGLGVIFEYDIPSGSVTRKFDLAYATGGAPWGSLTQSSNGKLYGMTSIGGVNSGGVIFEYDPTTNAYSDKFDFGGVNGSGPYGNLTQASNGKLYGMTAFGGTNGAGVLFEYDPATSTYTKELDFDNSNGNFAWGNSLVLASNGRLYGITSGGGYNFAGVLFEYDPTTATYTKLMDFDGGFNGGNPQGSLTQGVNGKLYGMAFSGGAYSQGVLFEYDLTTATYTKKLDFDAVNGQYPYGQLLVLRNAQTITFGALASKTTGDSPFTLTATASSGLSVTYTSSDPTVASISGNTVTILKAGTTIITANQAGDQTYLAAPAVQQTLTITSGSLAPVYVISPPDGAVNLNVTLTVTAKELKGAKTYTIAVSPDNTFTTGVITKSGDRSQRFTGLSYNTKYYARVKTNKSPDYGKVTSFNTATPEFFAYVVSPANGAVNTNVTLNVTSNSVIGATTYFIDLSPDNTFATRVITKSGGQSLRFAGLTYRTTYYARVKTNLSPNYGKTTSFTTAKSAGHVNSDGRVIEEGDPEFVPGDADAFPNPFCDRITVQVPAVEEEVVFVQLFDIRGIETVRHTGVTNSLIEVGTAELSTGMYILKIATSKGIKVTKVIKE